MFAKLLEFLKLPGVGSFIGTAPGIVFLAWLLTSQIDRSDDQRNYAYEQARQEREQAAKQARDDLYRLWDKLDEYRREDRATDKERWVRHSEQMKALRIQLEKQGK